jgi:hypothetical protein
MTDPTPLRPGGSTLDDRTPPGSPPEPATAETRRDWQIVQEDVGQSKTDRLKVADGYLYRTTVPSAGVAMVFVADRLGT